MATIQKWGNSLAVRIPMAIAGQLAVTDGAIVDLEVRDGELVVRPTQTVSLSLAALLRDCKPSQLHGETDFGPDVGREKLA
ncbi:MAG: AbrB/MazE/SpoVT family DNA-binding domain-containing protein [Planctomycetia bacterium]|nr:AbrB/MazE/SpoVT family DNA-binding domain-containing protein [Planctomycetia bacterium]